MLNEIESPRMFFNRKQWVKKSLAAVSLSVLGLGLTMTSPMVSAADGFESMTPFSRVAKIKVVKEGGEVDYVATYQRSKAIAKAIAAYVARSVESDLLGSDVIRGGDWKLGGTTQECLDNPTGVDADGNPICDDAEVYGAILAIPSPEPINPHDQTYLDTGVVTPANTKKANVLEFCNKKYASLAMGVDPIVDTRKVVNGYAHAPILPCKVSVWNDDKHIYVDMLDPSAIFSLFFSDVLFSADMQDPVFAEALSAMPPQVKNEIKEIIYAVLADFDAPSETMDQKIGPKYNSIEDIIVAVASSPLQSPYLHMTYMREDGNAFSDSDSKKVAQAIINTMSLHGTSGAGKHTTEITEDLDGNTVTDVNNDGLINLDDALSGGSSWRSARHEPITVPGKNHIIEACSPKYAKMAMSTGLHHVNALPCKISVKLIANNTKLVVSYLDPFFMLGALFADITDEEKEQFANIPGIINRDLQNMVKAAIDVNVNILDSDGNPVSLTDPVRKEINMLP